MDDNVFLAIFIPISILGAISLIIALIIIILSIFTGNPIVENAENIITGLTWFGISGVFSLALILPRLKVH